MNKLPAVEKVGVVSIVLNRAEGPIAECGEFRAKNWDAASTKICVWARTAPASGGYDKVDFAITWADGETYKGRYDMTRKSNGDLSEHINSFLGFMAHKPNCKRTACERNDAEAAEAREFAEKYVPGTLNEGPFWCCEGGR